MYKGPEAGKYQVQYRKGDWEGRKVGRGGAVEYGTDLELQ